MALWTAKVFVNSQVGEITATVESGTDYGARAQIERIYGHVQQIVNLREVRSGSGGSGSSSSPVSWFWILVGLGAIAVFGGGGGGDKSPAPAPQSAPIERSYTPAPAATPSYANPPGPCVTANFEPC